MQPVLIGAGAGGLVLGFIIGFVIAKSGAKKAIAEQEERAQEIQHKLESAKKEAAAHLEKERNRALEAEKKLAEATQQITALQGSLDQQKAQVKQLQNSLAESEAMRAKAVSQAEAHANARQQAEGRVKQAEATASQAQQALGTSQNQVSTLQSKLRELEEAVERRNREVQKLRGEVSALRRSGGDAGLEESASAFSDNDGTLESILRNLVEQEGQRAAVLADANGIIVAAVGEAGLKEGMAATSHLVGSMCTQLVDMVPFASIRSYSLQDTQTNIIAGRAFVCQGETVGLVTYGSRQPSDRVLDGAMAGLSAVLE
jgi:multidrug efflux pump subunit AcrA (membrane-fusion protein)